MTRYRKDGHGFNWKGGRTISSHGYVLIWVGEGHPDADVRGYAYEHKLVAQKKIGRKLLDGELVHHKDENTQNNDPDNLEVLQDVAHHRFEHRSDGSRNRLPDEENTLTSCACGCGATFLRYDEVNRPRLYISGHNPFPSPTVDKILDLIRLGIKTRKEMLKSGNIEVRSLASCLSKMKKNGTILSLGNGAYELPLSNQNKETCHG